MGSVDETRAQGGADSGHSDVPLAASEVVRAIKVLGKPYTREQLACALREALDG
jgi:hypothetical protein